MPTSQSLTHAQWLLHEADESSVESLRQSLGISSILARCLVIRNAGKVDVARQILNPTMEVLHDPYQMLGMKEGVERLRRAIKEDESIRVVTDYDVDGTTSSLILQASFRLLGATRISYHIPERLGEGYGFSLQAAERAAEDGVTVLVTADIGIRDQVAVSRARELGIDVIICDHHLPPGDEGPKDATAILCPPRKGCSYPNPSLAACGIAFKLAQALLAEHPRYDVLLGSMLKLAAIGTVADIVDLSTPENRAIVALGLHQLNRGPHTPGLTALLESANTLPGSIGSGDLAFQIGPRINAAGRLASATAIIDLLTTRDPGLARTQAEEINRLNQKRQEIQASMLRTIHRAVGESPPPFLLFADEESDNWHRGVSGIVAGQIRDRYHRPSAVVAISGGVGVGSLRSTPEIHAVRLLEQVSHLFADNPGGAKKFGGHPAAAGFTIPAENLREMAQCLQDAALDMVDGEMPGRRRQYDAEMQAQELTRRLYSELSSLAPHGKGNPQPRLVLLGARFHRISIMKEVHLKARLAELPIDVIWWRGARHREAFESGHPLDLLGKLGLNVWRGRETLQFTLKDARYAASGSAGHRFDRPPK